MQRISGSRIRGKNEKNKKEVCRIGVDINYKPMFFKNENIYLGFEYDLIDLIFDETKYEYEIVEIDWQNKYSDLQEGKIDCIISGLSMDENRNLNIEFSESYFENSIYKITNMHSKNKIIGVPLGCSAINLILNEEIQNYQIYDSFEVASQELRLGKAKYLYLDSVHALSKTWDADNFRIEKEGGYYEKFAVGMNRGSKWKKFYDKQINNIVINGQYDDIYNKWFKKIN